MNKKQYIDELSSKLIGIDGPMKEAILKQYDDIFENGYSDGKTDEEITTATGDTDFVSTYYINELKKRKDGQVSTAQAKQTAAASTSSVSDDNTSKISNVSSASGTYDVPTQNRPVGVSIIRGLFVGFGLLLFNLVIVLGPYLGIWGVIVGLFATGLALSVSGIAVGLASFIAFPFAVSIPAAIISHPVLLIATCAILISLGIIFMLAMLYIGKYLGLWTVQYLRWNFSVIRGDDNA